jgi:hypothetical protein
VLGRVRRRGAGIRRECLQLADASIFERNPGARDKILDARASRIAYQNRGSREVVVRS